MTSPHLATPGGGGYLVNVYTGRLLPEVQPLFLLYTIFHEKGTPFIYLLSTKGTIGSTPPPSGLAP